jgi:hypothetical protein
MHFRTLIRMDTIDMLMRNHIVVTVATLCILLSGVAAVHGQGTDEVRAARIKAGMVYHLSQLTEWPDGRFENDSTPITVGVLGKDPHGFADYFRSESTNFTAQGRSFVVKNLSYQAGTNKVSGVSTALKEEMQECHILFVTAAETRHLVQILAVVGEAGVLTVGESENFSITGGMVSFVIEKSIVKINVNMRALEKGRIKTSSEFLRHAQLVESDDESDEKE